MTFEEALIRSGALCSRENLKGIRLTVISRNPLDEDRFRAAMLNWIKNEKIFAAASHGLSWSE